MGFNVRSSTFNIRGSRLEHNIERRTLNIYVGGDASLNNRVIDTRTLLCLSNNSEITLR